MKEIYKFIPSYFYLPKMHFIHTLTPLHILQSSESSLSIPSLLPHQSKHFAIHSLFSCLLIYMYQ